MKSESINQWVTLGANIGVLLGILLLAYELNQNNDLLEAQISFSYQQNRRDVGAALSNNEPLARVIAKASSDESLSDTELLMLIDYHYEIFIVWEWEYLESLQGRFSPNTDGWKQVVLSRLSSGKLRQPGILVSWGTLKLTFRPDFVDFMETNVISQLDQIE